MDKANKTGLNALPIGIFDSGLGGLTALKEIRRALPGEDLVYFGDTARVPYGTRSRDTILRYAAQDIRFLLSLSIKAVVVACGTVSTVALEALRPGCPVYIEGVLQSAVDGALAVTKGRVAVLGTPSTIASGAYEKHLRAGGASDVLSVACPLFVPLVENGFFARDNALARLAVEEYLAPVKRWGADTVILGCTHYPLLAGVIGDYLGDGVTLVDAGRQTALTVAKRLKKDGLLSGKSSGSCRYYVSDAPEHFSRLASVFLEKSVDSGVTLIDIESK